MRMAASTVPRCAPVALLNVARAVGEGGWAPLSAHGGEPADPDARMTRTDSRLESGPVQRLSEPSRKGRHSNLRSGATQDSKPLRQRTRG